MTSTALQIQRRPRIIRCDIKPDLGNVVDRVNAFAGAHDDDVILLADGRSSFVDTYVHTRGNVVNALLTVHFGRTDQHDDPLAWFSDITAECRFVIFFCRVTSAFIQRRLPGLDPHWYSVNIRFESGQIKTMQQIRFSRFYDHSDDFVFAAPDAVEELHRVYAVTMQSEASFLFTFDGNEHNYPLDMEISTMGPKFAANATVLIDGQVIQGKDQPFYLAQWHGRARDRAYYIEKVHRHARRSQSVQFVFCSKIDHVFRFGYPRHISEWYIEQQWLNGSRWRTPRAHACIFDVCLGLASLWLPPYVLLEIIDYLPFVNVHRALWKIRLIQRVLTSLRRCLATRNTISRSTRSRTKSSVAQ